jgi:hypothetical protein
MLRWSWLTRGFELSNSLVRAMSETGRLVLRTRGGLQPVAWDTGEPWRFQLTVRAGDDSVRQKRLGNKGLVAFLTVLSAFVALSTDLYLPALPAMTQDFGVPEYQTNLTLTLFFVFYAVAILV